LLVLVEFLSPKILENIVSATLRIPTHRPSIFKCGANEFQSRIPRLVTVTSPTLILISFNEKEVSLTPPHALPDRKNRGNSSPYLAQSDFNTHYLTQYLELPTTSPNFLNSSPLPTSPIKAMHCGGGQLGILVAARQQRGVISGTRWWRWQRWQRQLAGSAAMAAAARRRRWRHGDGGGSALVAGSVAVGVGGSAAAA
jgi:hypothetical protein